MITAPALRYYGGKWALAPWIISHFRRHNVYVEPFAGGANVLLQKHPAPVEVYNDLHGDIVTFFRVLRDHGAELAEAIRLTPYARSEYDACVEALATQDLHPVERARCVYVVAWQGFGCGAGIGKRTGWRRSKDRSPLTTSSEWHRLLAVADRLRHVQIEQRPALEVLGVFDSPETLFYVDPPYVTSTRCVRWSGDDYVHSMDDAAHAELLDALDVLEGMVILSGYRSDLYDDRLSDWQRVDAPSVRLNGTAAVESLWISSNARTQLSLLEVA